GIHVTGVQTCALPFCAAKTLIPINGTASTSRHTTTSSISDASLPRKPDDIAAPFLLGLYQLPRLKGTDCVLTAAGSCEKSFRQRSEGRRVGKGVRSVR